MERCPPWTHAISQRSGSQEERPEGTAQGEGSCTGCLAPRVRQPSVRPLARHSRQGREEEWDEGLPQEDQGDKARKGKKKITNAIELGSKPSSQSAYAFLSFVISTFFSGLLHELLPYLMCLLYGCRLNGALRVGDPLVRLNLEGCLEEHSFLERVGRAYKANLERMLESSVSLGIVKRTIDLSVDPTHIIYWGEKAVKRWGSPFSTMMNKALPGLYP